MANYSEHRPDVGYLAQYTASNGNTYILTPTAAPFYKTIEAVRAQVGSGGHYKILKATITYEEIPDDQPS